jgi:hypothetical protein
MFGWIFLTLLVSAAGYVLLCGDKEQRLVLCVLLAAYSGTMLLFMLGTRSWLRTETGIVILDSSAFVALTIIAFRSKRFWPLWIASFQLIPLLTYAAALFGQNLASQALGVAQGLWAYLQLGLLVLMTLKVQIIAAKTRKPKTGKPKTGKSSPG